MKELKMAFGSMVSDYQKRLDAINNPQNIMGFSAFDIFSLRPFHIEINKLSRNLLKIYKTQQELPENSRVFACIIQQGALVQVREFIKEGIYRDSLFVTANNSKWRYMMSVDKEKITPVKVERLEYDNNGLFSCFESYEDGIYSKDSYSQKQKYLQMDSHNLYQNNQVFDQQYNIYKKEQQVTKIERVEEGKLLTIFDEKLRHLPWDKLLAKVKKALIQSIVDSLQHSNTISDEIMMMLLEYNLQTPFPPTVALAQTAEYDKSVDNNELCWFYNAPDLEYFSEEDNLTIDFVDESLYSELNNRLLEESDRQTLSKIAFDFYLELVKSLKRNQKIKQLLSLNKKYHVTARDFEEGNEVDFLREILSPSELAKIEQEIEDNTENHSLSDQDKAYFKEVENILKNKSNNYHELNNKIKANKMSIDYALGEAYFLQPFYLEIQHGEYLDLENIHPKILMEKPNEEKYCEIHNLNNRAHAVFTLVNGNQSHAKYYVYESDHIDEYYFSIEEKEVELISFATLMIKDKRPQSYQILSKIRIHRSDFEHDSKNRIIKSNEVATLYSPESQLTSSSYHLYEYDNDGISCIKHIYKEMPTVVFSNDYLVVNESKQYFIEQAIKAIVSALIDVNLESCLKVELAGSDTNGLVPQTIRLSNNTSNKVSNIINIKSLSDDKNIERFVALTNNEYLNHYSYYQFKSKMDGFVEQTMQQLSSQLEKKIKLHFDRELQVEWQHED